MDKKFKVTFYLPNGNTELFFTDEVGRNGDTLYFYDENKKLTQLHGTWKIEQQF
jgi:hypothetical protein